MAFGPKNLTVDPNSPWIPIVLILLTIAFGTLAYHDHRDPSNRIVTHTFGNPNDPECSLTVHDPQEVVDHLIALGMDDWTKACEVARGLQKQN